MDCRTTSAHKFRTRLRFKQYDAILTKEQSVPTKIMSSYFHDYKLAIETNKNRCSDRNVDYEIKRLKATEQKLGCKFIRTDPDKEDLDIFKAINEIFRHIKQSTKKSPINEISTRLLWFEFRSDKVIKSKAIKFIVKKILPDYK